MRADAQSFDHLAADYDRLGELDMNPLIARWLERQLPTGGGRALDLGCGTGRHAVLLAERFGHVDAIDLSGPMIDLARARRRGRTSAISCRSLFPGYRVDVLGGARGIGLTWN